MNMNMDIGGAIGNVGTIQGYAAKLAIDALSGATKQPEPDAQAGGKKKSKKESKKKYKKKSKKKFTSKGGDDIVEEEAENLNPWEEISKAIFTGGNKKKQTLLENEFNYPFMILGIFILFKIYKDNN